MLAQFNLRVISSILGVLMAMNAGFMLLCIPVSIIYSESSWISFLYSGLATSFLGALLWYFGRSKKDNTLKKKDGYFIVSLGWVLMSFCGSFPYLISGAIPNLTNAFFETISGYSTTGATILTDIEALDKGILFWRSLTQWIGGMGIIVLTVAILPILGIGGMQLFVAEAPGITPDKMQPRIKETAKRLWFIYLGLTLLETLLLFIGGMDFYDAINHSLTTMATGGFSTKNDSIAHFQSPFIQYVIIFFMFLAGTSFTLNYFLVKRNFKKVWQNEEFRYYISFVFLFTITISGVLFFRNYSSNIEESFRDSLFQVVSVVTTTGYITKDYTSFGAFIAAVFFMLMFIGGSAGSTAGGVKIVRHIVLLKNSFLELKRQLHPSAIIPVRFNGHAVKREITFKVLAFMIIYLAIFATGTVVVSALGVDFISSLGATATCLGNIGPGIGSVGPVDNFFHLPQAAKWFLSFIMLLGRLELFTVLILFAPSFWEKA